jgi:hypothetical protein
MKTTYFLSFYDLNIERWVHIVKLSIRVTLIQSWRSQMTICPFIRPPRRTASSLGCQRRTGTSSGHLQVSWPQKDIMASNLSSLQVNPRSYIIQKTGA